MPDFTKGIWGYFLNTERTFSVVAKEGKMIAEVLTEDAGRTEAEANARLIASAPEMYKILCNIRDQLSEVDLDTDTEDDIHVILACIDGKEASYD